MRSYRVTVAGRFDGLTAEQKEALRSELADHDMFNAEFSREGTFIYSSALTRFTVRYFVESDESSPAEADVDAVMQAEAAAEDLLKGRGISHSPFESTFTCLEDVKVRKR